MTSRYPNKPRTMKYTVKTWEKKLENATPSSRDSQLNVKSFFIEFFKQKGVVTPRAFVDFDRLKDPEPKYFEEILRNSLSEDKGQQFCADFLALFRPKKHKHPVPCAIGSADSGKTSLFAPVFQIIPLNRIARVTKQKSFNKAMIDSCTGVIFLDEAFSGLLEIDDWKILCQGGFTSHDVKWKKAEGFHCNASMYITCQTELDFGADHNEAMDKRLHKYHFRSLSHVNPEANKWLRQHAMDCIVWSQKIAGDIEDSATPKPVVTEHGLPEEDLKNILSVSTRTSRTRGSVRQVFTRFIPLQKAIQNFQKTVMPME